MIDIKYPSLMYEIEQIRIINREKVIDKICEKYPEFQGDLNNIFEKKYPQIKEAVKASIETNLPELKRDDPRALSSGSIQIDRKKEQKELLMLSLTILEESQFLWEELFSRY